MAPDVLAAFDQDFFPDPCAQDESLFTAFMVDQVMLPAIHVPVMLVFGEHDKLVPPPNGQLQRLRYQGSNDVTYYEQPAAGHNLWLARSAPVIREHVADLLTARHM